MPIGKLTSGGTASGRQTSKDHREDSLTAGWDSLL